MHDAVLSIAKQDLVKAFKELAIEHHANIEGDLQKAYNFICYNPDSGPTCYGRSLYYQSTQHYNNSFKDAFISIMENTLNPSSSSVYEVLKKYPSISVDQLGRLYYAIHESIKFCRAIKMTLL